MDQMGVKVGILNAGDGQHEHPSQALLDLLTICATIDPIDPRLSLLKDKKITIVGDILHSRVARSNIWSLTASGAQVHLVAPPTLLPTEFADYCQEPRVGIETSNLFVHWQLEPALKDADFVMTLRLQQERMTEHLLPSLRETGHACGVGSGGKVVGKGQAARIKCQGAITKCQLPSVKYQVSRIKCQVPGPRDHRSLLEACNLVLDP